MMFRIFILLIFSTFFAQLNAQDFYDVHVVKDIKITFEEENWEHVLDSLKFLGTKNRLVGTLEVDGMRYDSVGVRYKGNSSYFNVKKSDSPKLPFNIKVNYIKKDQQLKNGYKSIKLSNVFRDPSYIREVLSYEIVRKYMPAPKANFARVYVNNELIGLYSNVESINDDFVETHFGDDSGYLYKCDPDDLGSAKKIPAGLDDCQVGDYASLDYLGGDSLCYERLYELKSDAGWKELIELTKTLESTPEKVFQQLNIDQVLWMHALNNVLVNLDSYSGRLCHNYYMYKDTAGVFHPLIWDLNLSFGGFRFADDKRPLDNEGMQNMNPFLHYKNDMRPLVSKVLSKPLYRKMYVAHMQTILKENFTNEDYLRRIRSMQQSIDFYVKNDQNNLYDYESFKANVDNTSLAGKTKIIGVKELMSKRAEFLNAHPLFQKEQPTIERPSHRLVEDNQVIKVKVDNAMNVFLAYRSTEKGVFKLRPMLDNGENGDETSLDYYYTISLPKEKVKHYYIIAEAEKTAQLSPERASMEFYEIK